MSTNQPTIHWVTMLITALGIVAAHGQGAKPRDVPLEIRGDDSYFWIVNGGGDGFSARKLRFGEKYEESKNFRATADGMWLEGKYMGYDLTGKDPSVLARDAVDESTEWRKEGGRFGLRLQALKGPYKWWWVGLRPNIVDGKPVEKEANLVLVQDKKDAVQFRWEDPNDKGP
jgi:hypothetical protein